MTNEIDSRYLQLVEITYEELDPINGKKFQDQSANGAGLVPIEIDFSALNLRAEDLGLKIVELGTFSLPVGDTRVMGFKDKEGVRDRGLVVFEIDGRLFLPNFTVDHFMEKFIGGAVG